MRAAVIDGVGMPFRVDDVDLAPPAQGEVLIRVAATGVCGSDLNASDGKRRLVPFPAVLGHEAAGVVTEIGPGVTRVRPGDHVVTTITPWCGTCTYCLRGMPNFCLVAGDAMAAGALFDGTSRLSRIGERVNHFLTVSSFAEQAVVPESGVVAIRPDMPLDRAALISCAVLTGFGAVANTAKVPSGARVAVFGCGGVGLNIVQGARVAGATPIVAVDVSRRKLDLAARLGATDGIDSSTDDPTAVIRDRFGGVDFAFDASGREEVMHQAWRSLDVGGELVLVGLLRHGATLTLPADPFVNEQRIRGCYYGSSNAARDIPALVERYLAGEILLDEIISQRIALDGLNGSFDRMRTGEGSRDVVVFD
jgi:S-(hydroxymethyl)glutathione dehydrogenase/alcohol dehydrogenase